MGSGVTIALTVTAARDGAVLAFESQLKSKRSRVYCNEEVRDPKWRVASVFVMGILKQLRSQKEEQLEGSFCSSALVLGFNDVISKQGWAERDGASPCDVRASDQKRHRAVRKATC